MKRGVPTLDYPHTICTQGKKLTPEQAQLLKLVGEKTVEFRVRLRMRWDKESETVTIGPDSDEDLDDPAADEALEEEDELVMSD